jgi:hypothetical protein
VLVCAEKARSSKKEKHTFRNEIAQSMFSEGKYFLSAHKSGKYECRENVYTGKYVACFVNDRKTGKSIKVGMISCL